MRIQIETITLQDGSKMDVIRDVDAVRKMAERAAERKKADEQRKAAEDRAAFIDKVAKAKAYADEAERAESERLSKEKAAKIAAEAPDTVKILAFAATVGKLNVPILSNREIMGKVQDKISSCAIDIEELTMLL